VNLYVLKYVLMEGHRLKMWHVVTNVLNEPVVINTRPMYRAWYIVKLKIVHENFLRRSKFSFLNSYTCCILLLLFSRSV